MPRIESGQPPLSAAIEEKTPASEMGAVGSPSSEGLGDGVERPVVTAHAEPPPPLPPLPPEDTQANPQLAGNVAATAFVLAEGFAAGGSHEDLTRAAMRLLLDSDTTTREMANQKLELMILEALGRQGILADATDYLKNSEALRNISPEERDRIARDVAEHNEDISFAEARQGVDDCIDNAAAAQIVALEAVYAAASAGDPGSCKVVTEQMRERQGNEQFFAAMVHTACEHALVGGGRALEDYVSPPRSIIA